LKYLTDISLLGITSANPFSSVFNPSMFPSLRTFTWYQAGGVDVNELTLTLSNLLDRVEALSLDSADVSQLSKSLMDQLVEKTLFDTEDKNFEPPSAKYLRFIELEDDVGDALPDVFDDLGLALSKVPSTYPLKLIYLPAPLESSYFELSNHEERDINFLTECERRKITVIFEETPALWALESGMSEDFSKRMRERKKNE
jgi:hypothetical protein